MGETKKRTFQELVDAANKRAQYAITDTSDVNADYIKSFMADSQKYLNDAQGIYDTINWGNASATYDERNAAWQALSERANKVGAYYYKNRNRYSNYDDIASSIDEILTLGTSNLDSFSKIKDYYGQWETEDDYYKNTIGWLDEEAPNDVNNQARQQYYKDSEARIAEIKSQLPWYSNAWMPNAVEDLFLNPEQETLRNELEKLQAENNIYKNGQGVLDQYYVPQTVEFLKNGAYRDYVNPTKEELLNYNLSESAGSVALNSGGYYDEEGNIRDRNGNIVYSATSPQVQDKLGMFFSAVEDGTMPSYMTELASNNGLATNTWANIMREGDINAWQYLSEREINIYYDLLKREGQESAYRFLDAISNTLTKRETQEREEYINNAPVMEQIGLNALSVPLSVIGGTIGIVDDITKLLEGKEIDPYSRSHMLSNSANAIRTDTANDINAATGNAALPWLDFTFGDVYQSLMSGADSVLASFIPGGHALLGLNAASSEMKELYDRGASKGQMIAGGLLAGAAEAVFEKVSIGELKKLRDLDKTTVKNFMDGLVKTIALGGVEATEEMATEAANTISDALVMGSQSDWVDVGTFIKNVVNAGLGGLLSGGAMGAVGSLANNAQYKQRAKVRGQNIIDAGKVGELKEIATEQYDNQKGSTAKTAMRLVKKSETAKNVGKLADLMDNILKAKGSEGFKTGDGTSIAQIKEDGKVELESGKIVDAKSVSFANESDDLIFKIATQRVSRVDGWTNETANAMVKGYDGKVTATAYRKAYISAFEMGKNGEQASQIVELANQTGIKGSTLLAAYDMGMQATEKALTNSTEGGKIESEVKTDESTGLRLRNSSKRNGSKNSQKQVSGVEESTGRDTSREDTERKVADSEAVKLVNEGRKVKVSDLGILNGSKAQTVTVVDKSQETSEMKKARKEAEKRGLKVRFFLGDNLVIEENGELISVRGYIKGEYVFVRADHPLYTSYQLMRHEIGHDMIAKGEVDINKVRAKLEETVGKENIDMVADMYAEAYTNSGLDADALWEECICDSLGDMNVFSKFADIDQGVVNMLLGDIKQATEDTKTAPNKTRGAPSNAQQNNEVQKVQASAFVGESGNSYNKTQAKLLSSVSTEKIENALRKHYAPTSYDIGVNEQTWSNAGLTTWGNTNFEDYSTAIDRTALRDELARRSAKTKGKTSRELDSYAPTFYSQMARVVDNVKQDKLAANSVVNMLRGKGVKAEEIKWSGIETFLEGKKSVTKAELQEFAAGSQLTIEEEMGSGGAKISLEPAYASIDGESADLYVMRGGEVFDTLVWDKFNLLYESESLGYSFEDEGEILDYYSDKYGEGETRWSQYKLDGGTNYRELVFKMPNSTYTNNAMRMHWGNNAQGVLAHARIQDFDVNGKKMLFVEEIQSDWHNEGQKMGYAGDAKSKALYDARKKYRELDKEEDSLLDSLKQPKNLALPAEEKKSLANDVMSRLAEIDNEKSSLKREFGIYVTSFIVDVPDAPFKDNYHEYVLKRLIRMAAEEGYDSIGWTPADIQSERWSNDFAEGYRIEYDQDIPSFLKKYGKKWGATVGKTTIEGETVWSMPITDSMKQSVLYEGQPRFSRELDIDYLSAVERGDMATAQRMVDEAAKNAGYNSPKLYHGTQAFGFTEFDLKKMDDKKSIFLTDSEKIAATYSGFIGTRQISDSILDNIDKMSANEIVDELNSGKYNTGEDDLDEFNYSYLDSQDINSLIGSVNERIEDLQVEVPQKIKDYADKMAVDFDDVNYKTHSQLVKLNEKLQAYDYNGLSTTLYLLLHNTDAFNDTKENAKRIADLERDIRLVNKLRNRDNSGGVIVESWLGGYSLELLNIDEAKNELTVNNRSGNYALYAKLGKSLTIDCDGGVWNDIRHWSASVEVDTDNTQVKREGEEYQLINADNGTVISEGTLAVNTYTANMTESQRHRFMVVKANSAIRINTENLNTTRDISDYALKNGYDSVVFKNLRDNGGRNYTVPMDEEANIYVLFNPNSVKSADTVTYDDEGNVIPLSQRFNEENEDIRYSRDLDIEGDRAVETKPLSNRELLANALLDTVQNEVEYKKLDDYKAVIKYLEAEETKLESLKEQIRSLDYNKDKAKFKELREEIRKTEARIDIHDKKLLQLESTTALKNVLERAKKKAYSKALAKGRETLHANVEGRHKTIERNRIKDIAHDLDKLLNKGTKKRNVKMGAQPIVRALLDITDRLMATDDELIMSGIVTETNSVEEDALGKYRELYNELHSTDDDVTNHKEERKEIRSKMHEVKQDLVDLLERERKRINKAKAKDSMTALIDEYAKLKNANEGYLNLAYKQEVYDHLVTLRDNLKEKLVSEMTLDDLKALHKACTMIQKMVTDSNKIFREGKTEDIKDRASSILGDVNKLSKREQDALAAFGNLAEGVESFNWKNLRPVDVFTIIGSPKLKELFWDVINAQDKYGANADKITKDIVEFRKKYGYKKWDTNKAMTIKTVDGDFKVTLGELMSIYAYSKREQADLHMSEGGFQHLDKSYYKDDKGLYRKRAKAEHPYRIGQLQRPEIISMLTKEQREYVDALVDYITKYGEKGNEVSRVLYGIDLFTETHYFPLKSSHDFLASTQTQIGQTQTTSSLSNIGMSKPTVPNANNPIILQSFDDVILEHLDSMSKYNAYVIPIENLRKVLDFVDRDSNKSLKTIIGSRLGVGATNYLEQYITDLNGGKSAESGTLAKMFGKGKAASVMMNLSVWAQQYFSIIRAMSKVNPKYFVPFLGEKFKNPSMKLYEEMKTYAPITTIKEMGGFDVGSNRALKEYVGLEETKFNKNVLAKKANDIFGFGANLMDKAGWMTIWSAIKKEVAHEQGFKEGSDAYFDACRRRMNEVITETQVYDSVNARSGMMRSKSELDKFATSFMGEPTVIVGMAETSVVKLKRAIASKDADAIKEALGDFAGVAASIVLSIAMGELVKSAIYAMRDDDEDETFAEKYATALGSAMANDINPMNYIPYARDISSLIDGWTVDRPDMQLIEDFVNASKKLLVYNEGDNLAEEGLSAALSFANLFGLPLKNALRDIKAMINLVETLSRNYKSSTEGLLLKGAASGSWVLQTLLDDKGTLSKSEKLYRAMVDGDVSRLDYFKSTYEDEKSYNSALRKSLRDNDPRVEQAALARLNRDNDTYYNLMMDIVDEGIFDRKMVKEAFEAEYNYQKRLKEEAEE